MNQMLKILHVEDDLDDIMLVRHALTKENIAHDIRRVDTEVAFREAIREGGFDLILCDFSLPTFDGHAALSIARETCPYVPFIYLSGTIGEERAVNALQRGATDYVLKDRLSRLGQAIRRALRETVERARHLDALEDLRKSEERFRLLVGGVRDYAIIMLDARGCITTWNSGAGWITGYGVHETIGRPFSMFYPSEGHGEGMSEETLEEALQVAITDVRYESESWLMCKGGTRFWAHLVMTALLDGKDNLRGFATVVRDLTDRKRAEATIREQAALLNIAHDAILTCDMGDVITFWNGGARALYGWTEEEALGQKWSSLLQGQRSSELSQARARFLSQGQWGGELDQVTKTGERLVVQSRWTLLKDEEGNPRAVLIINTDITEKKRLETQFLRAQRLENVGTLAGGIAHDLNNVLTPIIMAAQLLRMGRDGEDYDRWLAGIEASAQRGAAMVRQILTFARGVDGERGVLQLKHLVFDLEGFLKQTFPRTVQIDTVIAEGLWAVLANSTQLYQVLLNLCINARDAMPDGGRLTLRLDNAVLDGNSGLLHPDARPGPYVVAGVSDTGTGIPPDILGKIFDPFFTTKGQGKGTGLGLATVAGITKSHGGFITVHSLMGEGTEFKIFLPADPKSVEESQERRRSEKVNGHGELVLVVDDEAIILEMTRATLIAHGYRVLTATDGAEAMSIYMKHRRGIALVVTDMMMPVMNGSALIRELRAMDPNVRVIATTGLVDLEPLEATKGLSGIACLAKPYSMQEFLTTVQSVFGKGRKED